MLNSMLIRGGRVIDPANGIDKVADILVENGKVAIRNIRRDAIEHFKKQQKASEITEDELKIAEKDLQKMTDDNCKVLDKLLENKEKELMSV